MSERQLYNDIYNTMKDYEVQLQFINEHTGLSTKEKKQVIEFINNTVFEGVGIVQRIKYIYGIRNFYDFFQAPLKTCKPDDLKSWLSYLMNKYKMKTVAMRWYSVKKFYTHIGMGHLFDDIRVRFHKRSEGKLPEELLTREDVGELIRHVYNARDKALIAGLYESGCRIGEFLSRKVKHLAFDQHGAVLTVDGKTGMRRVRLIESVPLFASWLEHHADRENPDAPLWLHLQKRTVPVKYAAIAKMLKDTGKKAKIKKKIHPHLFRHSRATELAKHLTEQQLKAFMGWTNASDMAAIYVHLSGKDVDDAILKIYDKKPIEEQEKPQIKTCPRCTSQNHPQARFCNRCGGMLPKT